MKKENARILANETISDGIYSLRIACAAAKEARPGQFVSLYLRDKTKILPRPISICEIDRDKEELRLVYRVAGEGTAEISGYSAGEEIELLGPLGNGFMREDGTFAGMMATAADTATVTVSQTTGAATAMALQPADTETPAGDNAAAKTADSPRRVLLVGGGIGIPPMVGTAAALRAAGHEVLSVMGYRNSDIFLKEELEKYSALYLATDDGSRGTHGTVIDAIRENDLSAEPDLIYACGPKPMLRALKAFANENGTPLFVSMEERMACGIGACLACVCETTDVDEHSQVKNARVCKDGPVFPAAAVNL